MKRESIFALIALIGMVVAVSKAMAQTPEERAEFNQSPSELREAKEVLEAAAREVARLSAQVTGPIIKEFYLSGRRAMLGINVSDGEDGARVDGVTPGGPATESGIEAGDIIIAMDGAALSGDSPSKLLIAQMGNVDPGDVVTLTLVRNGDTHGIEVTTREFPPAMFGRAGPGGRNDIRGGDFVDPTFNAMRRWRAGHWHDMELVELTPELGSYFGIDTGILVVRAPSDVAYLEDGDVILEVGGRRPNSTTHTMRILGSFDPGETLKLTIMRDQRRQTLEIVLSEGTQGN